MAEGGGAEPEEQERRSSRPRPPSARDLQVRRHRARRWARGCGHGGAGRSHFVPRLSLSLTLSAENWRVSPGGALRGGACGNQCPSLRRPYRISLHAGCTKQKMSFCGAIRVAPRCCFLHLESFCGRWSISYHLKK